MTVGASTFFSATASTFSDCRSFSALVVNAGSRLTLVGSTFFNNSATHGGAIFFSTTPTSLSVLATIVGSTFDRNIASQAGGAIFMNNSVLLTVSSSTFKNNSGDGAVILALHSQFKILHLLETRHLIWVPFTLLNAQMLLFPRLCITQARLEAYISTASKRVSITLLLS